ncbi:GNAT family N-acetyltransferase [Pengzhenrongella phosphoraccumulans]|uniref:GNAT family N-acetyltransferase n=1 Tax=Pengzhenrongella phosphoraccumulans TaxID=3114394 RepID=UPI00388D055C
MADDAAASFDVVPIASLGFRTDLMLLSLQGSEIEDHDDYLVVRSPHNPDFWWGNFLLFRRPPQPASVRAWEQAFARELPAAAHRTFGVDGTAAGVAGYDEFTAAGYDVDASVVMTAHEVHSPPHPNGDASYRMLDLAEPRDRESATALRMANAPARDPELHRRYLDRAMEAMAALQQAGAGGWFGAFLDGQMVSGMGLFSDGSGLARFQCVDTHPDSRGRGLAGTLVHHVSTYGLTTLGAQTLVMVADPAYHAIRIYRSVGFENTETQVELERAP